MVFDLFVDSLQGGVPNQMYSIAFSRGDKFKETTSPSRADTEGKISFQLRRSFVATLQKKNSTSYKKKLFHLSLFEQPSGNLVSEVEYDLAAYVEHEVFTHKKLMIRSPQSNVRLIITLSGISEDDFIRLNSDAARAAQVADSTASLQRQSSYNKDDDGPDVGDASHEINNDHRGASSQATHEKPDAVTIRKDHHQPRSVSVEEDNDDLGDLVNEAVAQVSGRRGGPPGPVPQPTPVVIGRGSSAVGRSNLLGRNQPSASPDPVPTNDAILPAVISVSHMDGSVQPSVQQSSPPMTTSTQPGPVSTQPPSALRLDSEVAPSAAPRTAPTSPSPDAVPYSASVAQSVPKPARTDQQATEAASESRKVSVSKVATSQPQRSVSHVPPTAAQSGVASNAGKDVNRYLSEIVAAVSAASQELLQASRPDTKGKQQQQQPQQQSQSNAAFISGAKPTSTIPRATMLALHCLSFWRGAKRTQFLHDFLAMLFVEVLPNTRHAATWMSVLLHLMYHTLTEAQRDDLEILQPSDDPLTEEQAIQVADEVMTCIENTETSGLGSMNVFMMRGSRSDTLWKILAQRGDGGIDADDEDSTTAGRAPSVSFNPVPLPPSFSIILSIGLDEALRRLSDTASAELVEDITRYCFPPSRRPTSHTNDGFRLRLDTIDGSRGIGGGGADHPTDDPALSVVLNTLDRLYVRLHGCHSVESVTVKVSPLLRLANAELMKLIFANICNSFLNNIFTPDKKCRLTTVRDGMNFKLTLSMLEGWLQQHQLFTAVRETLLPCRQLCDLLILQKKLLQNSEVSDEVTSLLHPTAVVMLLEQFSSSVDDMGDYVPPDVLKHFRGVAEERARLQKARNAPSGRGGSEPNVGKGASSGGLMVPKLPLRPLSSFGFLDFVTSLLPQDRATGGNEPQSSLRVSITAAAKLSQFDAPPQPSDVMTSAQLERALNWDRNSNEIAAIRAKESVLGGLTTHDSQGQPLALGSYEQRVTRDAISLKLEGLSIVDHDTIRRMVV